MSPVQSVNHVAGSSDGRRIAVGAAEASVDSEPTRVFDATTLEALLVLEGSCKVLAFSADGATLLTSDGKKLNVHQVGR